MFSDRGIADAQSLAYGGAIPSFENRHGVPAAAERSTPLANRNRNRSAARSSADFQVTVALNPLHKRGPNLSLRSRQTLHDDDVATQFRFFNS